jgi:hypothetical protein
MVIICFFLNAYHKRTCFHQNNKKKYSIKKLDFFIKDICFLLLTSNHYNFFNIFL